MNKKYSPISNNHFVQSEKYIIKFTQNLKIKLTLGYGSIIRFCMFVTQL